MNDLDVQAMDRQVKQWLKKIKNDILHDLSTLQVKTKRHERDLVTQKDKEVENFLRTQITNAYPQAQIIGEESARDNVIFDDALTWIIDPIDGTANFVKQKDEYCVMIACFMNKQPLLSYIYHMSEDKLLYAMRGYGVYLNEQKLSPPQNIPLNDAMVSADIRSLAGTRLFDHLLAHSFDIRYIGCSGLDAMKVFTGCFGAFFAPKVGGPWDYAPYFLIAEELGLHLCAWDKQPLRIEKTTGFILSTKRIYAQIKDLLSML